MDVTSLSYSQQMLENPKSSLFVKRSSNQDHYGSWFKHDSPFSNDVRLREHKFFYSVFLWFRA